MHRGDAELLFGLFHRMSPTSRYRRYLTPKPTLTGRELEHLTAIDHVAHEAIAAIDRRDGSLVGVSRYATVSGRPGVADVAVEVADELQNLGIGTLLTRLVISRARENGMTLLAATTLWENRPARALLRTLGFRTCASDGGEIELALVLERRVAEHDGSPLAAQGRRPEDRTEVTPAPSSASTAAIAK
jgi:GNAT superfamily N-acetyltransferase